VKQLMQQESRDCICLPNTPVCICGHTARLRLVNKKVITPATTEVQLNPRSRSAKLRAAEHITTQEEYCQTTAMDTNAGGWRRPALLRKLRVTFSSLQSN
jgi:hypothetical protein